mmetsp:Transcript_5036/g.6837  ORF Transcript_5036/g.6837 Transcript_5036/m.6837 type:complete len:86 (-) Transcript_5036:135-392(-)
MTPRSTIWLFPLGFLACPRPGSDFVVLPGRSKVRPDPVRLDVVRALPTREFKVPGLDSLWDWFGFGLVGTCIEFVDWKRPLNKAC